MLLITPAYILVTTEAPNVKKPGSLKLVQNFGLLALVSIAVFSQTSAPLLFLIIPFSVFLAFRLGSRYAAIATLLLTVFSLACTYHGFGPAILISEQHAEARIWVVQLFCFVNLFTSLGVAAGVAEGDRLGAISKACRLSPPRAAASSMPRWIACRRAFACSMPTASWSCATTGFSASMASSKARSDRALLRASHGGLPVGGHLAAGRRLRFTARHAPATWNKPCRTGATSRSRSVCFADGGVICTYTDVTMDKRAEEELLHRSLHDVLTELPNRRMLCQHMERVAGFVTPRHRRHRHAARCRSFQIHQRHVWACGRR